MVVGVVMVAGWPIAHHVWAGNRKDGTTVKEVVEDVSKRFRLGRLVFVGDRGMVTKKNFSSHKFPLWPSPRCKSFVGMAIEPMGTVGS